jgi:beta-lactamase regulating signal transducer with metallopeptidase domain
MAWTSANCISMCEAMKSRMDFGASSGSGIHNRWAAAPTLLIGIWFLGCAAVLLTWRAGWRRLSRAVRQGCLIEGGREVDTLRRLERMKGLKGSMPVISSNMPFEPGVFGIAKPVLLWCQNIGDCLNDRQLEAIVAHEVCHVRRRDNLAAAVHMLVEAMFWFHPLIWWVERRLLDERERACDEEVIRWGSLPQVYAESILKTCEFYLESPFACVSGVTGSDLKKRIELIMTNRTTHALSRTKRLLVASAGVAAIGGPIVVGLLNAPTHSRSVCRHPVAGRGAPGSVPHRIDQADHEGGCEPPDGVRRARATSPRRLAAAARRLWSRAVAGCAVLRRAGECHIRRRSDLPLLYPAEAVPPVPRNLDVVRRQQPPADHQGRF